MGMTIDNDYIQQGWQCPICKRVYSPTTMVCMYCGGEQKTTITTSITHNYEDTNIVMIQYPNGQMTIDKNTGRMISWVGAGTYGNDD